MNNLYSVGERIILQSPNLSEHNGEYTIEAILDTFEEFTCRFTGINIWTDEGVSYVLDVPLLDLSICDGKEALWHESSLRKIQDVGELSFQELMETFKTEICVNN